MKNHSAWLLLRSKLYSESYSVFCLRKVRMLQKGFSQLSFIWSVKWQVSLKLWNNHSRDWINNFTNRHRKIADFSRFREIVTLFEIINDPRLKTDPMRYVLSVLFVKESLDVMVIVQVIDKSGFSKVILVFTCFILYCRRKEVVFC